MKKIVTLVALVALIAAGALAYRELSQPVSLPLEPVASPSTDDKLPPASPSSVPSSWKTYSNPRLAVAFTHPPETQVRENVDGTISAYFLGPTQTLGTELFDGYSVNLGSGQQGGDDFAVFVEVERQRIIDQNPSADPGAVSTITPVTVGELEGYQFTSEGLGLYTFYYLPLPDDKFVQVSWIAVDPAKMGYEEEVQHIISTLRP